MPRPARILLQSATALSLYLFTATASLCVLSYIVPGIQWPDGRGDLWLTTGPDTRQKTSGEFILSDGAFAHVQRTDYHGPWEILTKDTTLWTFPLWPVALATGALPAWRLATISLHRLRPILSPKARRLQQGLCPTCSYDLRATPDRCPECGTIASNQCPAPPSPSS